MLLLLLLSADGAEGVAAADGGATNRTFEVAAVAEAAPVALLPLPLMMEGPDANSCCCCCCSIGSVLQPKYPVTLPRFCGFR